MKKKVLVVDDELKFLELIKLRLEANNYAVITATNGKESIEKAERLSPDIIIMDIMMPELDGIATILKLKGIAETKFIPIIVCTAVREDEDEVVARNLDVADYFKKTDAMENLIHKIEKVLKK